MKETPFDMLFDRVQLNLVLAFILGTAMFYRIKPIPFLVRFLDDEERKTVTFFYLLTILGLSAIFCSITEFTRFLFGEKDDDET